MTREILSISVLLMLSPVELPPSVPVEAVETIKLSPVVLKTGPVKKYVHGLHTDKRRLTAQQRLEILENELLDPYRNPAFEEALIGAVQRMRKAVIAVRERDKQMIAAN